MALFKIPAIPDALDALLDKEREILLSGQIEALPRLAPQKEKLLNQLPSAKATSQQVEALRRKADRNQELLVAVSKGIRAVSRRLEALRSQKTQLRTYDAGGHSKNLAKRATTFEKRA
ncbi:flagellar biosynthesis protein FlgN [Aliiroseovarius crassostreae]|uniref:flagellar biosynthesis protein FlgN n=1 Tax=Aliiroseovarius crassostreae TaxID=154981 RepID=UPI003C7CC9FC